MQQKKNRDALLAELRELCATQYTGMFFILITGNNLAQFVLDQGEIIALSYNGNRGPEALKLIRQISTGSTRCAPHKNTLLVANMPLAPTAEILAALENDDTSVPNTPASPGRQEAGSARGHEVSVVSEGQTGLAVPDGHETATSPAGGRAAVCQLMSEVMNSLIEAFGDHGFGRDNLLQVVTRRLQKLQRYYPFLGQVELTAGKLDFTALAASSTAEESLAQAWGILIQEIHQSALDNLGRKAAQMHYNKVCGAYQARSQAVWAQVGVSNPLPRI